MEHKKLTQEDVAKADAYLPLALKSALSKVLAPGCLEKTGDQPPRWQENIIGRKLAETYVLAGRYLHLIDTSGLDKPKPEFDFTLDQYDAMSQLEAELYRLNACELVRDYRLFLDVLDREIKNQLARKNDLLNRMCGAAAMELTPDIAAALQEALRKPSPSGGEDG